MQITKETDDCETVECCASFIKTQHSDKYTYWGFHSTNHQCSGATEHNADSTVSENAPYFIGKTITNNSVYVQKVNLP